MKNIAYTPLDIKKIEIDNNIIKENFELYSNYHHESTIWKFLAILGKVEKDEDFLCPIKYEKAWDLRYDTEKEIKLNPYLNPKLYPILDLINQLPFVECTHAQILCQQKDVPLHYDLKRDKSEYRKYSQPSFLNIEPSGMKIMLTDGIENSFYVSKTFDDEKNFIVLPNDTNAFAINEKNYPHGALYKQENKYIVSCFGIIDKQKHKKLLQKSLKKYRDFIISY